jgi:hypothetical protein
MSTTRHEVADDGLAIFDLRLGASFRKRLAGYDKREVELYIRGQDAIMTKIRLEKEQLERQVIRLRQQLADAQEQLAETKADLADAQSAAERTTAKAIARDDNATANDDASAPEQAQASDASDHGPEDEHGSESASARPAMPDAETSEKGEPDADAGDTDASGHADADADAGADADADAEISEVVPSAS